jgi:hypothetical protein
LGLQAKNWEAEAHSAGFCADYQSPENVDRPVLMLVPILRWEWVAGVGGDFITAPFASIDS